MFNARLASILLMLVLGLALVSCGEEATEATTVLTTLVATSTTAVTTTSGPTTVAPGPTLPPPVSSTRPLTLLELVETVQVTPDANYPAGAFCRINYVPATDRFVVTFGGLGNGYAYKEYSLDMQETGRHGSFASDIGDAGSVMVGNTYYFATAVRQGESAGWRLLKIDAASWEVFVDTFFPLDWPQEGQDDPMVAFVNGQIDISSYYYASGEPPGPATAVGTYGNHHQFFTTDLEFLEERIITEPPQVNGAYMVFVDGVYYLVTANLYTEDVQLARYDAEWRFQGSQTLIPRAHFSTGLVFDGQRFYLAYTDTSQRTEPGFFPVQLNIHLAVFSRDWNLLQDVAVTDFAWADGRQPGRPWVIRHGDRLYVSYDIDMADPATHEELHQTQAYVSIYQLTQP